MRRAIEHFVRGAWSGQATATLTLDFDARHRRRIRLATDDGEPVLLDLARAVAMGDGDGLRCEDGSWLGVRAAPERLVEITAADADALARIAWHLGNRHVPTELRPGALRFRPDHVIEAMARGLGGSVRAIEAPFQPEGGAYASHGHGDGRHAH